VSVGEKGTARVIERAKWRGVGECERDSEWRENKEEKGAGEREIERQF
jgi:hypothetical protein